MLLLEVVALSLLAIGAGFFLAGTVGLIRFPDVYSRLHALTKADNLGLGFIIVGLALLSGSWLAAIELFAIWILVLLASSVSCHLIARSAWRRGIKPLSEVDK